MQLFGSGDGPSAGRSRVLAWPAFRKQRANPHAALLARELIRLGVELRDWTPVGALLRPGHLWHLHHPEAVLYRRRTAASIMEAFAFLGLLILARARGVRVLWTIHDLGSNDALHPRLEAWFWKVFVPRVDAFVCLSERSRALALARFPALSARPAHIVPHGHYQDAYPRSATRETARQRLGISPTATVLLNLGLLRPYKNIPHLIRTFRSVAAADHVLIIAGRSFDAAVERAIRAAAHGAENVRLDLRWIPPEEVSDLFGAADLVVLPYRRILNSGAVVLAMTLGRPVLVPDLGSMREQQENFGPDWIRLYEGELSGGELEAAIDWAHATSRSKLDLDRLSWRALAEKTRVIYNTLLAIPARAPHTTRPEAAD